MNNQYLISIIIPTYNRSEKIVNLVNSLLSRTTDKYQVIVVDDGSSDNTLDNLSQFTEMSRFELLSQKNTGPSAARNLGIIKSSGKYIKFLDSDDDLFIDAVDKQIKYLENNSDIDVVYSDWLMGRSHQYSKQFFGQANDDMFIGLLQVKWNPNFSYLYRKNVVVDSGMWNEQSKLNDDFEFALRVSVKNYKYRYISGIVGIYLWHPGERVSCEKIIDNSLITYGILDNIFCENRSLFNDERKNAMANYFWHLALESRYDSFDVYTLGKNKMLGMIKEPYLYSQTDRFLIKCLGFDNVALIQSSRKHFLRQFKNTIKKIIRR